MDIAWLGLFGLLCAGIGALTWACGRAVPTTERAGCERIGSAVMTAMVWLGSAATLGLFVYLVIALVRAEDV